MRARLDGQPLDPVVGFLATLVRLQLPGATRQISTLRHDFEDLHVGRAFGYLDSSPRTGRSAGTRRTAARRAVEQLTVRTLVDLLISVHPMRLAEGSGEPSEAVRVALRSLSHRLVTLD